MFSKAFYFASVVAICATSSGAATLGLDTLIGSTSLPNSGDHTELSAMESTLGLASGSLSIEDKIVFADLNFGTDDAGNFFANVAPNEPGYFILKFGTGNTGAAANYFFENVSEMNYLVWSNDQVNGLMSKCSLYDCRLSHVTSFVGDDIPHAPLPASGILLLAGLGGVAAVRRHK